ncbi:MAG: VanZ family protein [Pseudomonadota bacterium]
MGFEFEAMPGKREIAFVYAWGPVVFVAVLIFLVSEIPGSELQSTQIFPHADKVGHIFIYFVLGLSLLRAFARTTSLKFAGQIWLAVALTTLYGAADEFHQCFVKDRTAEFLDMLADLFGAIGANGVWWVWKRRVDR